jgi:Family of unknown function (DUF5677)
MSGSTVLDHLGPFTTKPPIQALILLTQRAWEEFHAMAGGQTRLIDNERKLFASRLMYISEVMSLGLRMSASWGLTHAAMSLLRDRFEQTIRFSWLAKQPDGSEHKKFMLYFYSKARSLMRDPSARRDYEQSVGSLPPWVTEELTKEQNAEIRQWESLDLRTMATRRDSLPPLTDLQIGKEELGHHYDTVYAQFSSVAHFDAYSLQLFRLHETDVGQFELATDAHWPGLLILQNCQFDIIQCFEALNAYYDKDAGPLFNALLLEWYHLSSQMDFPTLSPSTPMPAP